MEKGKAQKEKEGRDPAHSKRLESKPAIDYAEEGQWNDAVSVSAESVEEEDEEEELTPCNERRRSMQ